MTDRHLRNRSVTIVEDKIERKSSNEVDVISSLENAAVNQEIEAEKSVMSEREGNHSDSMVSTEVGVCMSTGQLQDLISNAISVLRTDIVEIIEKKETSSVYDCTVEDVEYIYNSNKL